MKSYHDAEQTAYDSVRAKPLNIIHVKPSWRAKEELKNLAARQSIRFKVSYEWSGGKGLVALIIDAARLAADYPDLEAYAQPDQPDNDPSRISIRRDPDLRSNWRLVRCRCFLPFLSWNLTARPSLVWECRLPSLRCVYCPPMAVRQSLHWGRCPAGPVGRTLQGLDSLMPNGRCRWSMPGVLFPRTIRSSLWIWWLASRLGFFSSSFALHDGLPWILLRSLARTESYAVCSASWYNFMSSSDFYLLLLCEFRVDLIDMLHCKISIILQQFPFVDACSCGDADNRMLYVQ